MAPVDTSDLKIVVSDETHVASFIEEWVSFYLVKQALNPTWNYRLFSWEGILRYEDYESFAAVDSTGRLEGLLAIERNRPSKNDPLYVAFLAAAPWNHGESRLIRGVGTGLVLFAIGNSQDQGRGGKIQLSSTPESESFYEKLDFIRQRTFDAEGLPHYALTAEKAKGLLQKHKKIQKGG